SIPELRQHALIVRPAWLDAHPDFEKYLAAEQAFHVAPRSGRDRLHARSALAEQDRALTRLLHEDGGVNAAQIGFMRERVDRHRRGIRQFLAQQPENLLSQILGREEALVAVGEIVRGV